MKEVGVVGTDPGEGGLKLQRALVEWQDRRSVASGTLVRLGEGMEALGTIAVGAERPLERTNGVVGPTELLIRQAQHEVCVATCRVVPQRTIERVGTRPQDLRIGGQ